VCGPAPINLTTHPGRRTNPCRPRHRPPYTADTAGQARLHRRPSDSAQLHHGALASPLLSQYGRVRRSGVYTRQEPAPPTPHAATPRTDTAVQTSSVVASARPTSQSSTSASVFTPSPLYTGASARRSSPLPACLAATATVAAPAAGLGAVAVACAAADAAAGWSVLHERPRRLSRRVRCDAAAVTPQPRLTAN
jgi:hypothetical protein